MVWDWLHRILYWRQIRDELREIDEMAAREEHLRADLDRRIAEVFTPEEWHEVAERCQRKLAERGIGA